MIERHKREDLEFCPSHLHPRTPDTRHQRCDRLRTQIWCDLRCKYLTSMPEVVATVCDGFSYSTHASSEGLRDVDRTSPGWSRYSTSWDWHNLLFQFFGRLFIHYWAAYVCVFWCLYGNSTDKASLWYRHRGALSDSSPYCCCTLESAFTVFWISHTLTISGTLRPCFAVRRLA